MRVWMRFVFLCVVIVLVLIFIRFFTSSYFTCNFEHQCK